MGLSLVPVRELPPGLRFLRLGTVGRDVHELQKILAGLGFFPGSPHGRYDLLTREAVKSFQHAFHLTADGVVGPKTWRMLGEPGIWNRKSHRLQPGETLAELASRYGVAPGAWKDPAARRRIKRLLPGDLLLLEKRELWLAEEELPAEGVFCTWVLCMGVPVPGQANITAAGQINRPAAGQTGEPVVVQPGGTAPGLLGPGDERAGNPDGLPLLKLLPPWAVTGKEAAGGVVVDLRNTGGMRPGRRYQGKIRKALRALRQNNKGEIFWWLAAGDKLVELPKDDEADGILFSANTSPWCGGGSGGWRAGSVAGGRWRREVKNLLARYPCTRVILHFDLRGREITPDGEVRILPAGSCRALRLFQPGQRQRLADGWLQLQSGSGEKEHKFIIADRNTLREIFAGVDRLNLRGVFLTGIQGLEGAIMKEAAQFFLVLSQARS